MELEFQQNDQKYLRCIVRKSSTAEVNADCTVSEQSPDLTRVIAANTCVCVREKQCRNQSASVNGGVRVTILYAAENDSPIQKLDAYLPFSVREENELISERSAIQFAVNVQSADVRILHSRKVSVRIVLAYTLEVYEPDSFTIYTPENVPSRLQLRQATYPLQMTTDFAERSFTVSDAIVFPKETPLEGSFFYAHAEPEITEQRLAGSKAVFKGVVHGTGIYESENGRICNADVDIPFSQYCETDAEEGGELSLLLTVADCDWQISEDKSYAEVALNLIAQCTVTHASTATVTEDAYCIGETLKEQRKQVRLETVLDTRHQSYPVHAFEECNAADVIDAQIKLGQPYWDSDGFLWIPSTVEVLYRDDAQQLHTAAIKSVTQTTARRDAQQDADVSAAPCGVPTVRAEGGGLDTRYTIGTDEKLHTFWETDMISGGETEPKEQENHAAVLVRFVRDGETLWEIAKACNTTVAQIRAANRLEEDAVPSGMLLIPM